MASHHDTRKRVEQDIAIIDLTVAATSIAVSLKRIADTLEKLDCPSAEGDNLGQKIYYAIYNPLMEAMAQWARHR